MIDPWILIDYPNMPQDEVISEIVRLAESNEEHAHRKYSELICNYLWDCNKAKQKEPIEQALLAITGIQTNHSRMVTMLRTSLAFRNSIDNWYSCRDKILEIVTREEPDRVKRLMIGLLEEDPKIREEMDGLDAWQSVLKGMAKYA
jgi:hypothetical protein